jgi:DNA-binding PadR family transcriptional regulator
MRLLTRTEEIILAAVWKLQDEAYGVAINNLINHSTGLNWKFGSIYTPLGRLVDKGLLEIKEGEPSPTRGGRRKQYFNLTDAGKEALINLQKLQHSIWVDMPILETEKK